MSLTITIPGAVNATTGSTAPATLTVGVGVPGATGATGPAGPGVPAGGTAGQFLYKVSGTDYDTDWNTINLSAYAPLASPALTGTPTAPTATTGDTSTQIATTAFVQGAVIAGSAHAETLQAVVRNATGSTLAPFTVVYINGALGNKATVAKAQANSEATSSGTFAVTESSIANNADGNVISAGVLSNVDTSAFVDGDKLYLSPSVAGGVTTTKPSAPNHLVYVGVVTRSHPTLGTVSVRIQNGYELDELHNVSNSSLADNDLLAYESATSLWKNKTYSALGLLTSATAASTYATIASPTFTGTVTIPAGASISGYLTSATAASTYQTISGMSSYLTTAAASTTYAALAGATFTGLVSTPASTTITAGLRIAHGAAPTTPTNGDIWTTTSGLFARINGGTQQYAPLGSTNTFTGSNTFSGTLSATGSTVDLGNSTGTTSVTLGGGSTTTGLTKTINIGTSGQAGSTTNVTIGTSTGTITTTIYGANLAGGGTTTTSAADTNTTAIASTAFVVGQAGSATPLVDGTAAVGTSLRYARQDHVHPTDTTRAPLASPTFTGTVTIPAGASISGFAPLASPTFTGTPLSTTAAVDTNTTQIATTAYVVGQGYLKSATASSTYAPLASPALTGTPTAPTATAGTNTTQVATTAFVRSDNNVKMWVNFNGTGTIAIRTSYNVTSLTDNGVGTYTVNYTNAISADAVLSCLVSDDGAQYRAVNLQGTTNNTTTSCKMNVYAPPSTQADASIVMVSAIR